MATILDRHGKPAPTVTVADLKRRPGRFWKLTAYHGAVAIDENGETLAVGLSLDQFVSLLFGISAHPRRKKHKSRGKPHRKR